MNAISRDYKPALPNAVEAERVLLGAILQSNDAYWSVCGFLKPEHFFERFHGDLYETMGTMLTNGNPVSVITVKEFLPADKMVGDDMTAFEYVIQLFSRSLGAANAVGAARNIVNIWARRRAHAGCGAER
jgi:replicative DNA helicase